MLSCPHISAIVSCRGGEEDSGEKNRLEKRAEEPEADEMER